MQPYPTPNYFMQYQQTNPYLDRMAQLQQFQQTLQPVQNQFQPLGKIVESIDVVKATDIPMDGAAYYFPKADGSAVYSKQWLQNGTTRILAFKLILEGEVEEPAGGEFKAEFEALKESQGDLLARLDVLSEKIDKISKQTKTKKEAEEDES